VIARAEPNRSRRLVHDVEAEHPGVEAHLASEVGDRERDLRHARVSGQMSFLSL